MNLYQIDFFGDGKFQTRYVVLPESSNEIIIAIQLAIGNAVDVQVRSAKRVNPINNPVIVITKGK